MSRYLEKAIQGEIDKVAAAKKGIRNNTLNAAAFSLGQLVSGAGLDRGYAESVLAAAGDSIGLPSLEAASAIRSGLNAGEKKPRSPSSGSTRHNGSTWAGEEKPSEQPLTAEFYGKPPWYRNDWFDLPWAEKEKATELWRAEMDRRWRASHIKNLLKFLTWIKTKKIEYADDPEMLKSLEDLYETIKN